MKKWKLSTALFLLIGSTTFTLVVSVGGFLYWNKTRTSKRNSEKYQISAIIQTGPEKEALKTTYLAELLDISIDHPQNLYAFDLKEGQRKLLSSPLIRHAEIKRLPPSTLYIDYEVRKPVAYLGDFKNMGIDEEGYFFPIKPFFSPKRLPEIYLGVSTETSSPIHSPYFNLALEILKYLERSPWEEGLRILTIDVSYAFEPSLGRREIVLTTEEEISMRNERGKIFCTFPKIIRLSPKDYTNQLENFFKLQRAMIEDYRRQITSLNSGGRFASRIVDLRIPQLAFVEKGQ